jgi:hypothetical protein
MLIKCYSIGGRLRKLLPYLFCDKFMYLKAVLIYFILKRKTYILALHVLRLPFNTLF